MRLLASTIHLALFLLLLAPLAQAQTGPGGVGTTDGTSALEVWLDAQRGVFSNAGCTLLATNGQTAQCWVDQSGNGRNATETNAPALATGATNGQAALSFDGAGDHFDVNFDFSPGVTPDLTIFAVFTTHTTDRVKRRLVGHDNGGWDRGIGLDSGVPNGDNFGYFTGSGVGAIHNISSAGAYYLLAATYTPNTFSAWVDGTQRVNAAAVNNGSGRTAFTLGTNGDFAEFWDGDIAEVIVMSAQVTEAERLLVENYLTAKYQISGVSSDGLYTGDDGGNGNYDFEVGGIGTGGDGSHTVGQSGPLTLAGTLPSGSYLIAGRATTGTVGTTTNDLPEGMSARWDQDWYLDKTGTADAALTFDFGDAGVGELPQFGQVLLYRSSPSGAYSILADVPTIAGDRLTFSLTDGDVQDGYYTVGYAPVNIDLPDDAGTALSLDGLDDEVSAGTIDFSGKHVTLEAWINVSAFSTEAVPISNVVGIEVGNQAMLVRLGDAGVPADQPQFVLNLEGTEHKIQGGTVPLHTWTHVAATYDGTTMALYLDGAEVGTAAASGALQANQEFVVGGASFAGRNLAGQVDEVRLWQEARTAQQLADARNQPLDPDDVANLFSYWRFDDGPGSTTVADALGNFPGTVSGVDANTAWQPSTALSNACAADCEGLLVDGAGSYPFSSLGLTLDVTSQAAPGVVYVNQPTVDGELEASLRAAFGQGVAVFSPYWQVNTYGSSSLDLVAASTLGFDTQITEADEASPARFLLAYQATGSDTWASLGSATSVDADAQMATFGAAGWEAGTYAVVQVPSITLVATDASFDDRVEITWSDLPGTAQQVEVYRGDVLLATVAANQGAYADAAAGDLVANATFMYCANGLDSQGTLVGIGCDTGSRGLLDGEVASQDVEADGTVTFGETGLAITYTAQTGADVFVSRRDEDPGNHPDGIAFYDRRWDVARQGSGAFAGSMTFTLPTSGLTDIGLEDPSLLRLYSRSAGANDWELRSSTATVDEQARTVRFDGLDRFSTFVVGQPKFGASDDTYDTQVVVFWDDIDPAATSLRLTRDGAVLRTQPATDNATFYADLTALPEQVYTYCLEERDASDAILETNCDTGRRTALQGDAVAERMEQPGTVVFGTTGLTLEYLSQSGLSVTVARRDETPADPPEGLLGTRYWYLERVGEGLFSANATFSLPSGTLLASDAQQPSRIRLYQRTGALSGWRDLGAAQAVDAEAQQAVFPGVNTGGEFALVRSALLTEIAFTATDNLFEDHVLLSWEDIEAMAALLRITRDGAPVTLLPANARTYEDEAGLPGTTYTYCLELLDDSQRVLESMCDTGSRRLRAPTGIAATDSTLADRVLVTWTDRSEIEVGYRVRRSEDAVTFDTLGVTNANVSFFADMDAVPGTRYTYCVETLDANGNASTEACDFGARGFVLPPLNVTATDGQYPDRVVLAWGDLASDETGYQVKRDGAILATLPADTMGYEDMNGLVDGTTYTYCVVTLTGSEPSVEVCDVGGIGILPAPANLSATNNTLDSGINLTWKDPFATDAFKPIPVVGARGFRIWRTPVAAPVADSLLTTAPGNAAQFSDTDALPGVLYRYCVATLSRTSGAEVLSTPVCATGQRAAILAATNVAASNDIAEGTITVEWQIPATTDVLAKVYRLLAGDTVLVKTTSETSFTDAQALAGVRYTYCVAPLTSDGTEAAYGAAVPGTCDTGSRTLEPVTSVAATVDEHEAQVALTWTDQSEVETGYRVVRSTRALAFDGTDDQADAGTLDLSGEGLTLEAWFFANDFDGAQPLAGVEDGSGNTALLQLLGDSLQLALNIGGTVQVLSASGGFDDEAWYHVAATYEGRRMRLYVDGLPVAFRRQAGAVAANGSFRMGSDGTNFFNGMLDGVRVWDRARTGAELRAMQYQPLMGDEPNLVAAWAFEAGQGTTAADLTGSHDATLAGATWTTAGAPRLLAILGASKVAYEDKQGVPGRVYRYGVFGFDAWGRSATRYAEGRRTLLPPTNVAATEGTSETEVEITWVDHSTAERGYCIYRRAINEADSVLIATTAARVTRYTDPAPDFGITYRYSVLAFDDQGVSTSDADNGFTSLLPPQSVRASDSYTDEVTLAWVDVSAIEDGYRVYRDGALLTETGADAFEYTDSGAAENVRYEYCVATLRSGQETTRDCDYGRRISTSGTTSADLFELSNGFHHEDADEDLYGAKNAIAQGYLLVGAPLEDDACCSESNEGRVYYYKQDDEGIWVERGTLSGSEGDDTFFGDAVDISGDALYAVVGEPNEEDAQYAGRLYFYQRNGVTWNQMGDPFGSTYRFGLSAAISLDGRYAIGGSPRFDNKEGRALLFERQGSVWSHIADIDPPSGHQPNLSFGHSVDLNEEGSVIVVGAEESFHEPNWGRAFVFTKDDNNHIAHRTHLVPSDPQDDAFFGGRVAVDERGDWIFVGALLHDVGGVFNAGKVYGYQRRGDVWGTNCTTDTVYGQNLLTCREDVSFTLEGAISEELFGAGLAVNAERLAISSTVGNVAIYYNEGDTWVLRERLKTDRGPDERWAYELSMTGEYMALGLQQYEETGRIYTHELIVPPGEVAASDGTDKDQVFLEWEDRSLNEENFNIYRNGTKVATVDSDIRSFTDIDAAPGVVYEYCVSAFNATLNVQESVIQCDTGWRAPIGFIAGSITSQAGASVDSALVCLTPSPNRALLFDGKAGHVEVGEVDLSGQAFTLEAWINVAQFQSTFPNISTIFGLEEEVGVGNNALLLRLGDAGLANNLVQFVISVGGTQHKLAGSTALETDRWYHVAATYDGTEMRLYLDGQLDGARSQTGDADALGNLRLGKSFTDDLRYLNGRLDDVRIWRTVRSEADIQATMNQPLMGDEQNLAYYWRFDEGEGAYSANQTNGPLSGSLQGGAFWTEAAAPIGACALTDLDGTYTHADLRFGENQTFQVRPEKGVRNFGPAVKSITLSVENPVQNEINFTDVSSFDVLGTVTFAGTTCPVDSVEIHVDGQFKGQTESDGAYVVATDLGERVLEPQFGTGLAAHTFSPARRTVEVTNDVADINFTNTTKHRLRGTVSGGCGTSIGTTTIRVFTANGCFSETYEVDGSYDLALPPQPYFVQVLDVDPPDGLEKADVLAFFDQVGTQPVDLTNEADTLDLIYRAPLTMRVTGLDAYVPGCNVLVNDEGIEAPAVPILTQGQAVPLLVELHEDYGDGNLCPIDEATVLVYDDISLQPRDATGDAVSEVDTLRIVDGRGQYTLNPGEPEIFAGRVVEGINRSYQRNITFVTDVAGRDPLTETEWAVVEGARARASEFTTLTTERIPMLILRDPPGDQSYSYISQGTSICANLALNTVSSTELGYSTEVEVGSDGTLGGFVGFGAGVITLTDVATEAKFEQERSVELETTTNAGIGLCIDVEETIATSDDDDAYVGEVADLYVGAGLNLIFARADVLDITESGATCTVNLSETILGGLDSSDPFETVYVYTQTHLENYLIPTLESLQEIDEEAAVIDGFDVYTIEDQIENWNDILKFNQALKDESFFVENRSFTAGTGYDYSSTLTGSGSYEFSTKLTIKEENSFGSVFKLPVSDADVSFSLNFEYSVESVVSLDVDVTETVGYSLGDEDGGDIFTVDVHTDLLYGTPVFKLKGGATSYPWEPNTQKRDNPILRVDPPQQFNIDPEEPAIFTVSLTNASETKETREYILRTIHTANPGGAILKANGATIHEGLSFFVGPDQTQEITVTVERGASRYSHEDLEIMAYAVDDWDSFTNGYPSQYFRADSIRFSTYFDAPCSEISLLRPKEFWQRRRADAGEPFEVILHEFLLDPTYGEEVRQIGFEYRPAGTPDWLPAYQIGVNQLGDVEADSLAQTVTSHTTAAWTPPVDGVYELRGFTSCPTGKLYSDVVMGTVDTKRPKLLGAPEPADQMLTLGENIAVTFDEPIDCASVVTGLDDQDNVLLTYADGAEAGQRLSIDATCDGTTLVLTPNDGWDDLEGRLLTATLLGGDDTDGDAIGLTDQLGNGLALTLDAEPVSWSFTVRRSAFTFTPVNRNVEAAFGETTLLEAALVNGSAQDADFTIEGIPDWLAVDVTSGTLPPGGTQPLVLLLPDTLRKQPYADTLWATSSTQGQVPFFLNVEVVDAPCAPPSWSVSPAAYQYTMTITAQLFVDGIASEDEHDLVAAYVGDELRGVAPVSALDGGGNRVHLIVYSNGTAGELVRLEVFDADACTIHENTSKQFSFKHDAAHGTPSQPVTVEAPPAPGAGVPLAAGWTWFSTNIAPADASVNGVFGDLSLFDGNIVKGPSTFSLYDEGLDGWFGTLGSIEPGRGYLVRLSQSQSLLVDGSAVDASTTSLDLVEGWNWIGYLPQAAQPINDALGNNGDGWTPAAGDLLKGQTAFAQYDAALGWLGSLTELKPGEAYLLKTANAGSLTYASEPAAPALTGTTGTTQAGGLISEATGENHGEAPGKAGGAAAEGDTWTKDEIVADAREAEALALDVPTWAVDARAFEHTMVATVALQRDGAEVAEGGWQVGVFAGEELRGAAQLVYVPALDAYRAFVTVYSESRERDEPLALRVLDAAAPEASVPVGELAFARNQIVGSPSQPLLLALPATARAAQREVPDAFALSPNYPNPFNPRTVIKYALPQPVGVKLVVYDLLGREVMVLLDEPMEAGYHEYTFDASRLASGVYFYRLEAGDFAQVHKMILAK